MRLCLLPVIKQKKETVEQALELLITLKNQANIRNFRRKLFGNGDIIITEFLQGFKNDTLWQSKLWINRDTEIF